MANDYNQLNPAWGNDPQSLSACCVTGVPTGPPTFAGTSRFGYPATLRDLRIMCTGRLDPTFVIKALREGADGVLVMGCHPGQCHYDAGNYKAMRRMALLRRTVIQLGVHPDRVQLAWASASQGTIFTEMVKNMTETIARLGPLNWQDTVSGETIQREMEAVRG